MSETRKKRKWPWIVAVALLIPVLTVLYFWAFPQRLAKVILPDFSKVEEVKGKIHNDSLYLNAKGIFESKSFLPLIIDSFRYSFFVQDCVLYTKKKRVDLQLWPGQADTVNISVHVPFDRIRNISDHIAPSDSIVIGVRCRVIYKYFGRYIGMNFTKQGKILRPVPPKLKFEGLGKKEIKDWGKDIETEAQILVINDNKKLNITLKGLTYQLRLGNEISGHGHYSLPINIKPQTKVLVKIPLSLHAQRPMKTAYRLLFKKDSVPYRLNASAIVDFHARKHPGIKVYLSAIGNTILALK